MKFRRQKSDPAPTPAEAEQTGDDRASEEVTDEQAAGQAAEARQSAGQSADAYRAHGPWDADEVDLEEENPQRVDLGGLLVTGRPGLDVRLQVDENTQSVIAVMLVAQDGAMELRPFAAPRNGRIWDDIRRQIAAETARRGGTATEAEGAYGPELRVVMPVTLPDGKTATQPSRVLGITGPRWVLRATFLGRPALNPDHEGVLESALRDVVVVRGTEAMAPGDPLPLVVPSNARPVRDES